MCEYDPICLSTAGHMGSFQYLGRIDKTAVNCLGQVFFVNLNISATLIDMSRCL